MVILRSRDVPPEAWDWLRCGTLREFGLAVAWGTRVREISPPAGIPTHGSASVGEPGQGRRPLWVAELNAALGTKAPRGGMSLAMAEDEKMIGAVAA